MNAREYVHPDPLELLYGFDDPLDQEIVGLVAACLAYGRVTQILTSIRKVLAALDCADGGSPRAFLERAGAAEIRDCLSGFAHRFTTAEEMAALLTGVKRAVEDAGSLGALFERGVRKDHETVLPALSAFIDRLRACAGGERSCRSLLSSPEDGSACKRLNLYLRWMIRRDAVDPGTWRLDLAPRLVVPLDTHLFRISRRIGFTSRRTADLKTALEVTREFARFRPEDPVRYDFALTRLGINPACAPLFESLIKGRQGGRPTTTASQRLARAK